MSSYSEIAKAAKDAKNVMLADRSKGEQIFSVLLRKYPQDGMLLFKRGEAYEHLEEYTLAATDFSQAAQFFPMQEWKIRANQALTRVANHIPPATKMIVFISHSSHDSDTVLAL